MFIQRSQYLKEIKIVRVAEWRDLDNGLRLDRNEKLFDPINYWRGPMWINLSWLIYNGLIQNKYYKLAEEIKNNCISQIETLGFYEYFNSIDNQGCGDNYFSWTASIYICFISNYKF